MVGVHAGLSSMLQWLKPLTDDVVCYVMEGL